MKHIKTILSVFAVIIMVFTTSCSDDDFSEVTIGNVTPDPVFPLQTVTMQGNNYGLIQFVFLGDKQVPFQLDGDILTFDVPVDTPPGMTKITLAMAGGYRVSTNIDILVLPIPIIKAISPTAVPAGGEVTIAGSSLDNDTAITIGGLPATISSNDGSEMVVIVPAGLPVNQTAEIEITTIHGVATSTSLFFVGQSLIVNSDLELGVGDDFDNWEKLNGGDQMTEVTGDNAYYGRSMHVVGAAANPWNTQFASQPIMLTPGVDYTIILWAKAESEGAIMRTSVSQWPEDYFYGADTELTTDWAQYQWTFTGQELPNGSKIVLDMGHTDIPFVVDNITLIEGGGGAIGPEEILTNGGFEDGLTSWEVLNGSLQATTSEAYCGSQSLEAVGTGGNHWDVQIAVDATVAPSLEIGTMYELGFWAKAAGADGVMRASVSRWASGQSDDFFYTPDITVATDWTYYGFVFTAETTSTGIHQIVMDFGSTNQTFYVDDISLKEYVPSTSLYTNGGFEDGLTDWELLNGAVQVTNAEAYEGSGSLEAVGTGGNHWDVQIATTGTGSTVSLDIGSQYKLSFWAKAAGDDGVMRASVTRWASGQSDDFFYTPDITVTTDWQFYSYVFTAESTSTGIHQIVMDFGSTTQTFYVDNVNLSEYEDPCN